MLSKNRAYEIIDLITKSSRFYTTVTIAANETGLTRYAHSEIHQNVATEDAEVNIVVFDGEKLANVSTNVLDDDAILAALNSAELKLPLLQPSGMAFEELKDLAPIEVEDLDLGFESKWGISQRAKAVKAAVEVLEDGFELAGAFEVKHTVYAWGNSHGVRRYQSGSNAHVEVMVLHESGASGFNDCVFTTPDSLHFDEIVKFALEKAILGQNSISIEPGVYDVVLEPLAVNDLVSYTAYLGSNAKYHEDGLSPFTGKVGKAVASPLVTMTDDHTNKEVSGLAFDFEGYERQVLNVIDKGEFKGIAHDTQTAKHAGVSTTGHSMGYKGEGGIPFNIVVDKGNQTGSDLIKGLKRGLLVSRFHYMNVVDPIAGQLTALTRDGLFLVEDGKIVGAVKNLRFTDSIERILKNVDAVSEERITAPSFFGTNLVPGMRVKDFVFTGRTTIEE
ncbi:MULTISPECIES: TldD/PmbA family protein [unclassified Fusibacter]|uniref:TldD/PmbA family protein n=1 Tax=unclassified Fusibacter TaxID=2624464 RepID=UPI001011DFCA|nr:MULTISPECIES: metallopeptidase TldD-related protein [unclassified Fusibacter]MCK8059776.1 TldD/PmbA family protein [Fusibacter sp. A2]NPE21577.1 TldD/PmbA family protein [Fusibacter sp. A1]RXV61985.1 TldD/PmbA family protein [Fusibacter sp. A1]